MGKTNLRQTKPTTFLDAYGKVFMKRKLQASILKMSLDYAEEIEQQSATRQVRLFLL